MKQIIIISLGLFSVLSSCASQDNKNASPLNATEDCNLFKLVKTYYFDKDSVAALEVLKMDADNCVILQTKVHGKILSIAGAGNIDFVDENLILNSIFFEKDKEVLVLPTYIYGSTYGAVVYFLIYEGNFENAWEILKIPFDRLEIKTGKDNLSYILHYSADGESIKYIFKDGFLQQIK